MLSAVFLYLAIIAVDTDEASAGENYLEKAFDLIEKYQNLPEIVMVTLNIYNQFGILWAQNEPEKSKGYLEKAEQLYFLFKKSSVPPFDLSEIFQSNTDERNSDLGWKNFERTHTFTLYYLAQIYGALQDTLKSSLYCHVTLQRQLESKEYDPIDWALNSATLSQVFMEKNGFKQARNHLAASCYILDKYEEELNKESERNQAFDAKVEIFKHRSADVARCWAKYGLFLLLKSKERLLADDDDQNAASVLSSDLSCMNLEGNSTVTFEDLQNLEFTSLDLTRYESQITYKFILTMQDARIVFLNIQTWLQRAAKYYTLENLASDNIEIVQDQSQMYAHLLFFEDDPETQAKLHKRRIDILEDLIKKINPQYYLQYCRQIWYELAQIYSEILNIKSDKLKEAAERPSPHALSKINRLVDQSIKNFDLFTQSFHETFKNSNKVVEDYEKAYLQAFFHIGALHSRYITLDKQTQLKNVEDSYQAYKKVVDYCQINPKAADMIKMELSICSEMVSLLPVKMVKLRE